MLALYHLIVNADHHLFIAHYIVLPNLIGCGGWKLFHSIFFVMLSLHFHETLYFDDVYTVHAFWLAS